LAVAASPCAAGILSPQKRNLNEREMLPGAAGVMASGGLQVFLWLFCLRQTGNGGCLGRIIDGSGPLLDWYRYSKITRKLRPALESRRRF